jgi:serine/threonine-protein kinase
VVATDSDPVVEEDTGEIIPGWENLASGTFVGGRYLVTRLIAKGGAGTVYEALAPESGIHVAIKVLRRAFAQRERARLRFSQEARLISLIDHPNVVRYLGHGSLPDHRPYLVMEMLEGGCLFDRLTDGGPITAPDAFALFEQLCAALDAVHARGIVHRDLKPENVILSGPPRAPVAKLIDFGISKVTPSGQRGLTGEGLFIGSPGYMAPEQIERAPLDGRTDLYSLGLMMYEVFTDQWPWTLRRCDLWQQLRAHTSVKPRRDRRFERRCRPLADLVMRCLEKDPARRPSSAGEVRQALSALEPLWPLPYVGNPDLHRKLEA